MNLKKSDKIIAVVGVVILVVAAIGIIFYSLQEDENDIVIETEEPKEYTVKAMELSERITPDNQDYVVRNKIFGEQPYIGSFDVSTDRGQDLSRVEAYVEYEDSKMGLLLKSLRADTITIKLLDENDEEMESADITGSGNKTLSRVFNGQKSIGPIMALDMMEAREKLEENYSEATTESYTIKITINHGESVLRPLVWLSEKLGKDTFTLEITEYYYIYDLMEPEEDDDDGFEDDGEMSELTSDYSTTVYNSLNNLGFH